MHTVGSVKYVNAKPLVKLFERLGAESPVRVLLDVPSKFPQLIDSGIVEAALVSSFDTLRTPGRTFAEGMAIASIGDAESVRLFSKVPAREIQSLALDQSSLTTNNLGLVLLAEKYKSHPFARPEPPVLADMLAKYDACILIGDIGMTTDGTGLHVLDFGREWTSLTSLPFVWALWTGTDELSSELVGHLQAAKAWGEEHRAEVIDDVVREAGWSFEMADHYLRDVMNYDLSERHLDGLRTFRELLVKHGRLVDQPFPEMRTAGSAVAQA